MSEGKKIRQEENFSNGAKKVDFESRQKDLKFSVAINPQRRQPKSGRRRMCF